MNKNEETNRREKRDDNLHLITRKKTKEMRNKESDVHGEFCPPSSHSPFSQLSPS